MTNYLKCKDCNYKEQIRPNELAQRTPCLNCGSRNTVRDMYVNVEDSFDINAKLDVNYISNTDLLDKYRHASKIKDVGYIATLEIELTKRAKSGYVDKDGMKIYMNLRDPKTGKLKPQFGLLPL